MERASMCRYRPPTRGSCAAFLKHSQSTGMHGDAEGRNHGGFFSGISPAPDPAVRPVHACMATPKRKSTMLHNGVRGKCGK